VFVHVARTLPENPEEREVLHNGELDEIAWAELYPTEADARQKTI